VIPPTAKVSFKFHPGGWRVNDRFQNTDSVWEVCVELPGDHLSHVTVWANVPLKSDALVRAQKMLADAGYDLSGLEWEEVP
jgi:hypothetical protein